MPTDIITLMPTTNSSFNSSIHLILFLCHVLVSFKSVELFKCWWTFRKQYFEKKIYLYPIQPHKLELQQKIKPLTLFALYIFFCWFLGNDIVITFSLVLISITLGSFTCIPVRSSALESENLNVGYGAALCYYENYLKMILINFNERIEEFKMFHKVPVENKLFILIPHSCKVQKYLDISKYIERCQELPKHEETRGGIKNREYNITIYQIRNSNTCTKGVRVGIEYASPLKGLFALKEKQLISMEDMVEQRKLFVQTLQKFLMDQNDKFCELLQYDDCKYDISDILLEKCGLSNLIYETV